MSEEIDISVNSDPRELFVKYDINTIKKVREICREEIDKRKGYLQQFIYENYRPVLEFPPVLDTIDGLFSQTQETLQQITKNYRAAESVKGTEHPKNPYELYNDVLKDMREHHFRHAYDKIPIILSAIDGKQAQSLKYSVDLLPRRIFNSIKSYLCNPSESLTPDNLLDCFNTAASLFPVVNPPNCKLLTFLESSLVARITKYTTTVPSLSDLCTTLIDLIESVTVFLAIDPIKYKRLISIDKLLSTFKNSSQLIITEYSQYELQEVFRFAKTIDETTKNRLSSPQFVSSISKLGLKNIDFWTSAFQPFLKTLSAQSIRILIDKLSLETKTHKILSDQLNESFDAISFALSGGDLKQRMLGVSPTFSSLQQEIDQTIQSVKSKIQTQQTRIAEVDPMLRAPLADQLQKLIPPLQQAIDSSPLTVCHLAIALLSPSVNDTLNGHQVIHDIQAVLDSAAKSWSVHCSQDVLASLRDVPIPGFAFAFLVKLEQAALQAGGHVNNLPFATHLREEARKVVVTFIAKKLNDLEISDMKKRKESEKGAAYIFEDYSLLKRVLSIESAELENLFKEKMDPVTYREKQMDVSSKLDISLAQRGELIRLMCGRTMLSTELRSKSVGGESDKEVLKHVNALFDKVNK